MEVKRDKVKQVSEGEKLPEGVIRPREYAKAGCNKCYGRGIIGTNTVTDSYVVCKCVEKELARRRQNAKR